MAMKTIRTTALVAVLAALFLCTALPAGAAGRDPFADGSMRLSVLVGNGYAFDESYLVFGVGFGYFVSQGLELSLEAESWTSGSPGITKVSPGIRYVLPTSSSMRPYAGAFYRRTSIQSYEDLNSVGARAGVYFVSGRGSYFGAGGVYEKYFSCNDSVYRSCTDAYPELIFAIAF